MNKREEDFGVLLNVAFHVFKQELEAALEEAGFDDVGSSFGYVFRLLAPAPLSLRQLAGHLGITAQGTLKIVNDMVSKGYVTRHDDEADGRVKRLRLTPKARSAMDVAKRFHLQFERRLDKQLGAEQVRNTRAVLRAIAYSHEQTVFARPM